MSLVTSTPTLFDSCKLVFIRHSLCLRIPETNLPAARQMFESRLANRIAPLRHARHGSERRVARFAFRSNKTSQTKDRDSRLLHKAFRRPADGQCAPDESE